MSLMPDRHAISNSRKKVGNLGEWTHKARGAKNDQLGRGKATGRVSFSRKLGIGLGNRSVN